MCRGMVRALTALHRAKSSPEWVAIVLLISCYIEAIAADGGDGSRGRFEVFLRKNFRELCKGLRETTGRNGAATFYEHFRNKMAHRYFTPDPTFALAEDDELDGRYAGVVDTDAGPRTAINVDRLYRDFVSLARKRAQKFAKKRRKKPA